jgi:hypothetical protein
MGWRSKTWIKYRDKADSSKRVKSARIGEGFDKALALTMNNAHTDILDKMKRQKRDLIAESDALKVIAESEKIINNMNTYIHQYAQVRLGKRAMATKRAYAGSDHVKQDIIKLNQYLDYIKRLSRFLRKDDKYENRDDRKLLNIVNEGRDVLKRITRTQRQI